MDGQHACNRKNMRLMSPRELLCRGHTGSQFSHNFSTTFVSTTSSHCAFTWSVSVALTYEALPSFLGCHSQGTLVSGGATWAQALDDEDGAHHDAHEAHSQPQGTDHSLCQLWHRGWNLRLCKREVMKVRIQSVGLCACVWDWAGGVVFILQKLRVPGLGKRMKPWSVENKFWAVTLRDQNSEPKLTPKLYLVEKERVPKGVELVRTPVFEQWLIQAPVLHFAVINVIIRREEGEITNSEEGMIILGEETGLRNTLCDCMPVLQPCDIDHRGENVVHVTDEGVGLTQHHRRLGKHSHLRNLYGEETAQMWHGNSLALILHCLLGEPSHQRFPVWQRRSSCLPSAGRCYVLPTLYPRAVCGHACSRGRSWGLLLEGFKEYVMGIRVLILHGNMLSLRWERMSIQ